MNRNAFSLVEVVVVSELLLLISLVGIHTADLISQREKEDRLRYSLLEMRAALDLYHQEKTTFPASFNELLTTKRFGGNYGYYLRRMPINPLFGAVKWEIASQTLRNLVPGSAEEQAHWQALTDPSVTILPVPAPIVDIRSPDPGYNSIRGDSYLQW